MFLNHVTPEKAGLIEVPNEQEAIKDLMIDYLLKYKKQPTEHHSLEAKPEADFDALFSI